MNYQTSYDGIIYFRKLDKRELMNFVAVFEELGYDAPTEPQLSFFGCEKYCEDEVQDWVDKVSPYLTGGNIVFKKWDGSVIRYLFSEGKWSKTVEASVRNTNSRLTEVFV